MNQVKKFMIISSLLAICLLPLANITHAQDPVVKGVLFYSPSCPHCSQVINEVLPPLVDQYGTQLEIFGVDTSTDLGSQLFYSYIDHYQIPQEKQGVPALVIGDQVMVGSFEIPELLPGIIEEGLSQGGIPWPEINGLEETMQAIIAEKSQGESQGNNPGTSTTINDSLGIREKFMADLGGNTLSVIVLVGMLASLIYTGTSLSREPKQKARQIPDWLIPVLSLIGILIAGYLAFVEVNQVEAVCGPVGDCNTVQQSSYATLFGILPVGVLGVLGYIAIIIIWLVGRLDLQGWDKVTKYALWAITLGGTLFSIYLTFLEPFVIGASCMWCLTSAVIMTILFLLSSNKLQEPVQQVVESE